MTLLLRSPHLQNIMAELSAQFGPGSESHDFFDDDLVIVDFLQAGNDHPPIDIQSLMQTLKDCRLRPLGFRSAGHAVAATAASLGLVSVPPELSRAKLATKVSALPSVNTGGAVKEVVREVIKEVVKEVVRETPAPAALVIDKHLRSGQKIHARGTDLVLLAAVNQGAEVIADGNIHAYGPLRGKVSAGFDGNVNARIFALSMDPEYISIAGVFQSGDQLLANALLGKPAKVRLSQDGPPRLVFEPLHV